jgi:hypothetical protein
MSDAARLRREEEDSEDVVPGEWTQQPSRDADRATLDNSIPDDRLFGTTQSTEMVPTSQSLERSLSLSPLSQTAPTGSLDAAPCAQIEIDNDRVLDVAATDSDVMSSLTSLSSSEDSQPSQTS